MSNMHPTKDPIQRIIKFQDLILPTLFNHLQKAPFTFGEVPKLIQEMCHDVNQMSSSNHISTPQPSLPTQDMAPKMNLIVVWLNIHDSNYLPERLAGCTTLISPPLSEYD
jgi:hypothetical protein